MSCSVKLLCNHLSIAMPNAATFNKSQNIWFNVSYHRNAAVGAMHKCCHHVW